LMPPASATEHTTPAQRASRASAARRSTLSPGLRPAQSAHVFGGKARQNRDREHSRRRYAELGRAFDGSFRRGRKHLRASERMHRQQRNAGRTSAFTAA